MSIQVDIALQVQTCIKCGTVFALTAEYDRRLRETHQDFYCPNGHSQFYPAKTEAEKLREQLQQRERDLANLEADRARLAKQTLAKDKKIKQMERRAKAGVCQFCHRHFENMQRHMETKHAQEHIEF